MILDRLHVGCDEAEGQAWTVAADATVVRAHQHAAGRGACRPPMWTRRGWSRPR
jgi:hypothetical protein